MTMEEQDNYNRKPQLTSLSYYCRDGARMISEGVQSEQITILTLWI